MQNKLIIYLAKACSLNFYYLVLSRAFKISIVVEINIHIHVQANFYSRQFLRHKTCKYYVPCSKLIKM